MANLKTGISRKQSTPKFPKNKHFLHPDTHTCACLSGGACSYQGVINVCFLFLVNKGTVYSKYEVSQLARYPVQC